MEAPPEHWAQACSSADVDEGASWPAMVAGMPICLYRVQGRVYATEDRCSHGNAQLSDGDVQGFEVECPFHQGRFDVRTGQATLAPCTKPVRSFPAAESAGVIWIDLDKPE